MDTGKLTLSLLKSRTGSFDVQGMFFGPLSGLRLHTVGSAVNQAVELEHLDLSLNQLTDVRVLNGGKLSKLSTLNLQRNLLKTLDAIPRLPSLRRLYLQGNELRLTTELAELAKRLPSLEELYFQNPAPDDDEKAREANPLCFSPDYVTHVLRAFPSLCVLDGSPVTANKENTHASAMKASVDEICAKKKMEQSGDGVKTLVAQHQQQQSVEQMLARHLAAVSQELDAKAVGGSSSKGRNVNELKALIRASRALLGNSKVEVRRVLEGQWTPAS